MKAEKSLHESLQTKVWNFAICNHHIPLKTICFCLTNTFESNIKQHYINKNKSKLSSVHNFNTISQILKKKFITCSIFIVKFYAIYGKYKKFTEIIPKQLPKIIRVHILCA